MVDADTKEWLTSVYSPNGSDVYAVGSLGSIIKSDNSGDTWTEVANGYHSDSAKRVTPLWLEGVIFANNDIGYAVGGGFKSEPGIILKTEDKGFSWYDQRQNIGYEMQRECLLSGYFYNENVGWGVGNKGTIIKTINGGGSPQEEGWFRLTSHEVPWDQPLDY